MFSTPFTPSQAPDGGERFNVYGLLRSVRVLEPGVGSLEPGVGSLEPGVCSFSLYKHSMMGFVYALEP